MADLNALIAQGYQFQPPPDPFAQYGKMQQLQSAGMQNQLAQYQFEAAKRADVQANALNQAYASAIDPTTGAIDYGKVARSLATGGVGSQIPAVEKTRMEQEVAKLNKQKLEGEIASQAPALALKKIELFNSQMEQSKRRLNQINPNSPNAGEQLMAWHTSNHAPGVLGDTLREQGSTPEKTIGDIQAAVAGGPAAIAQFIERSMNGQTEFAKKIAPVPEKMTDGKTEFFVDKNQFSPTFGMKIGGAGFAKQITPGEQLTADTAAKRLTFEQNKFNYEKANPGKTIKEVTQADGSTQIFAIDNRTGTATPVMMAGAPGATPAGGGRGAVGVTDGRVGPATPLVGAAKQGALTEAQSNAAMFGSAMAQAQNVLDQVEKQGTKTGAVTTSLAQGIVKYVPLGVGDKLVGDVYALAMQDPSKLFGPDVNQQKLGQAQLAFAIAYLRKTSGAAFGPSELANTVNEFFPAIGEDVSVTKQKAEARKRAIAGMKMGAGKEGAKFIEQYEAPGAAGGGTPSANDPLGIRGKQ